MNVNSPLKDNDIDELIKYHVFSSIYLKNGIRIKGFLIGQDKMCVFLKEGYTQMIYKNRISTITPEKSFARFQ